MNEGMTSQKESLAYARNLVVCLEEGRQEEAKLELVKLTEAHETEMFRELGRLTRELHNNLTGFQVENKIPSIDSGEIRDARDRLNYVIDMTNQAAHKTLNAVEESIPICEEISRATADICEKWHKFTARDMTAEQFRALAAEISAFFSAMSERIGNLHSALNVILIAQDYQDLTGQTLRRVIKLVQDVEEQLVSFIKISTNREGEHIPQAAASGLQGPQIPGKEDADSVKSQDEVDDLLSSLGF